MKAITSITIDVGLFDTAKRRANAEGLSFSALVERALRADIRTPTTGATPPKLSKNAGIVLQGVKALHALATRLDPADIRYHCREYRMDEVCKKVGLFPSSALPALRECERVGVLKCVRSPPLGMPDGLEMDHWRLISDPEVTAG